VTVRRSDENPAHANHGFSPSLFLADAGGVRAAATLFHKAFLLSFYTHDRMGSTLAEL